MRQLGYNGGYSILQDCVRPLPRQPASEAALRFETKPGEQAQVDWGSFSCGVYSTRACDLLEDLRTAQAEHRLDRRMRAYLAPKVPIAEELGVWPCDRLAATALFSLISARYERGSVILTSSKGFAEWGEALGVTVIAAAILDRLLHHSHVLSIRGESYRLREKKRAALLGGPPGTQEVIEEQQPKR